MNKEVLFHYNIRSVCSVIDSLNAATGETIKTRIASFINLLSNDPFLGPIFNCIFELSPYHRLSMKTDDLYPSIDLPNEPVAQIVFVLNFMYKSVTTPRSSIFDIIFKLYGSGEEATDFVDHVLRAPLELLKVRLLNLSSFSWDEIQKNLSEILFPKDSYRFLTPDSLPEEDCLNRDRLLLWMKKARLNTEHLEILSGDFDLYIRNHNTYEPDICFIKYFLSKVVKYGGRMALSAILNTCRNTIIIPHIFEADPAVHPPKKRGKKPHRSNSDSMSECPMLRRVQTS